MKQKDGLKYDLKGPFLHSRVSYFTENLEAYREEQGERFIRAKRY